MTKGITTTKLVLLSAVAVSFVTGVVFAQVVEEEVSPEGFSAISPEFEDRLFLFQAEIEKWGGTPDATCQVYGGCALPDLGLYSDKLAALKASVTKAINALLQKRKAARAGATAGGQTLQGDPRIDRPLYLLQKMSKDLETDANGSLIDHAGLVKFYSSLKSLKSLSDPSNAEVIQKADDLTGFSYLYPPSPDKPMLIFLPGAGGEPGWRGATELLKEKAEKFNIVGYTYSPNDTGLAAKFRSSFTDKNLDKRETIIATISLGNTMLHEAILQDVLRQESVFSNTHIISVAMLAGGEAKFFNYPNPPEFLLPVVAPYGNNILSYLNPKNPVHTDIAEHMPLINAATKGVFYINITGDQHINTSNTRPVLSLAYGDWNAYIANRDAVFEGMKGNSVEVTAPQRYVDNDGKVTSNPHINGFYVPELKTKIDSFLPLLAPSP